MRISKFNVPLSLTKNLNLKEINLTKRPIGSTVALVGKNGAGKTRILNFSATYINSITSEKFLDNHITNIPETFHKKYFQEIEQAYKLRERLNIPTQSLEIKKKIESQINSLTLPLINELKLHAELYVKLVEHNDLLRVKDNIETNNFSFEQLLQPNFLYQLNENKAQSKKKVTEFDILNSKTTIQYFTNLATDISSKEFGLYLEYKDEDPSKAKSEIINHHSHKLFERFQFFIRTFLGKDFSYRQKIQEDKLITDLYLNNFQFDINLLSPGQKTLFAYAVLFYSLEINSLSNLSESIILIDEPEKHLHPEAQIQLIKALKEIIKENGQLWIATHSVHILSHLNYDEIYLVKDDKLIEPGRVIPGQSLNDLMGLDEHFIELRSFLNSESEWAFGNFIAQCFDNPDEIFSTNKEDPQYLLFKQFITNNVNVLDFGAGQGRIGFTILEDENISSKIRYNAFTLESNENLTRLSNLENLFLSLNEIPESTFDTVILCNVLHEIHPNEWIKNILKIKESLNDDGYLLFIEDRILPKGEKIDEFGYLILGNEEVSILMNSDNPIVLQSKDKEYKERLIFSAFKKDQINCTEESLVKSITKLKENAWKKIKTLRKDEENLKQGRKLANETQLYINSSLFLESVTKTKKL